MNPTEELSSLMDALVAKKCQASEDDRNVLADWISDHPEMAGELLAAMLRKLPKMMRRIIDENLDVSLIQSGDLAVDIWVAWGGDTIAYSSVRLQG